MGRIRNLILASLAILLASLGQAAAAGVGDSGGAVLDIANTGDDSGAAACMASQCSLADVKSAARAIAMAAGAKPAALDNASMFPESPDKTPASVSTFSPGTSQNSDVEPVLFAVIVPHSERSQLCIDEGNLLGMQPNCKPHPSGQSSNSGYDCEHTDSRFGMKIACRIGGEVPEPGTPILLGIALLGLVAARGLRTARRRSAASL
jgi:PEP-CTERM motif